MSGEALPRRPRLSEDTAERILAWLRDAGPNEALPVEREIAARLGVGRSTVREALQRLERLGLVDVRQGGRTRAAMPTAGAVVEQVSLPIRRLLSTSPGSLADLAEARLLLEEGVVRLACARADAAALSRLRAHVDRLGAQAALVPADGPARYDAFLTEDMAFHAELAQATGNGVLAASAAAAGRFLAEFHTGLVRLSGAEALTVAEHAEILAAVEARDADSAAAAMRAHLTRANGLYRQLEAQPPG